MKYVNFGMKLICFVAILGILWKYQVIAADRAQKVAENEAAVAEVEAYNEEILKSMSGSSGQQESDWADGVYEGEGIGFGGSIVVSVTVADGKLKQIDVLSADGEDPAYYEQAESVLEEMVRSQSTDVDTVSGATFSSGGLIEAAQNALEKAVE